MIYIVIEWFTCIPCVFLTGIVLAVTLGPFYAVWMGREWIFDRSARCFGFWASIERNISWSNLGIHPRLSRKQKCAAFGLAMLGPIALFTVVPVIAFRSR